MKTSKTDFFEFQKCFCKWQEKFGILNYEIIFQHKLLDDNDAELEYFRQPCAAIVRLNTEPSDSKRSMDELAKHEAVELFLAPARSVAMRRCIREDELETEFHSVVQALMRVVV